MSEQKDKKMDSEVQGNNMLDLDAVSKALVITLEKLRKEAIEKINNGLLNDVTRFETIDWTDSVKIIDGVSQGRAFVKYNCKVELQLQDDGRTLKVFVRDR